MCVLSCSGTTELTLEQTRVCGLHVDTGLWQVFFMRRFGARVHAPFRRSRWGIAMGARH